MPRSKAARKAKQSVDAFTQSLLGESTEDSTPKTSTNDYTFPFLQYTSLAGSHAILLSFAAVALPSSSKWLGFKPLPIESSLDRPQHPFLDPLTNNPTATVVTVSLGIFAIIAWWSGWVRLWWAHENKVQRPSVRDERVKSKLNAIQNAVLSTILGSVVYHIALVLFGAHSISYLPQTFALAVLLSILTIFTPVYTLGLPYFSIAGFKTSPTPPDESSALVHQLTWVRLFSELRASSTVDQILIYPILGTIFGCWLGVIPLALDWDRPWQAWPLVPAYGAIAGHIVGSLIAVSTVGLGLLVEQGRKVKEE